MRRPITFEGNGVRILLDTNVILDVALKREPFYGAAAAILEASDYRDIHLFITASSVTDLYYVVRKEKGHDLGIQFLRNLLDCVDVCSMDKSILLAALSYDFSDFEDAVQSAAAVGDKMDVIVTRNKTDYAKSLVKALSPDEFLAVHLA
jgi:predicted nucleic acid-binding protein